MSWSPVLVYGVLAALANILGGLWVSSQQKPSDRTLKYLIAIGAGFMLAAVFLKVIPASLNLKAWQGEVPTVMSLVLLGYLAIQFFEHTLASHFHFGEETHSDAMLSRHAAITAVGGLAIHTFFDGVSIASGFAIDTRLGLLIFIAILLHKLPEGFTVASIMLAAGRSRKVAQRASVFVGLVTLLGVISISLLERAVVYALPISAGVTLYVAASDLIPEVNTNAERDKVSLAVFGGVALYYGTETVLDLLHIG
ncbi:MAG: ZIP family metal transporter [Acidobacteriota bacterium]